jgi:hypothetical protein
MSTSAGMNCWPILRYHSLGDFKFFSLSERSGHAGLIEHRIYGTTKQTLERRSQHVIAVSRPSMSFPSPSLPTVHTYEYGIFAIVTFPEIPEMPPTPSRFTFVADVLTAIPVVQSHKSWS